ncbi:MAG TPA: Hsp20/alpha crystallin family protein [Acidimicrobiia bacterium]|jgi:HSP20 family protein
MAVMRWDPFAEVDRMLELMNRGAGSGSSGSTRAMAMDVYRAGDEYVVEMDLPGVDASSIDVNMERNMLTVEAEGKSEHEDADEVIVCERRHVRYRRQLYLGDNVDTENVRADYDNGVLRLRIPISTEQRARRIEVAASGERTQIGNGAVGNDDRSEDEGAANRATG